MLRMALVQMDSLVGDITGNTERIIRTIAAARDEHGADLVVFPELCITGYPPEDLLLHNGFRARVEDSVTSICAASEGIGVVVGYPYYASADTIYNAASLFFNAGTLTTYFKQCLPNYGVFDEKRYFTPGQEAVVVDFKGLPVALTICEDVWFPGPAKRAADLGAKLIINANASPYKVSKQPEREAVVCQRARECGVPIAYVNCVGGQDELVFDGGSLVANANAEIVYRAPAFAETLDVVEFDRDSGEPQSGSIARHLELAESVYNAIVLGVKDYVSKNGFSGVVLGLSGGIDSALTLAIAVDALGADNVQAVMMPSRYTSDMSVIDAREQTEWLGVEHHVIPIEPMFTATLGVLSDLFAGREPDATEENIQARCRGIILMAISNKTGRMLLTTGNKSEMAVGYATLYGDMAGGFAPIKDCSKTMVYRLANYRNTLGPAIPERVITRPPSAELAPDQQDSDTLPPYDILDPILKLFIEADMSVDQIVAEGFDRDIVVRVLAMIRRNEYKRRQAPPGVRVSERAFGRDWRYPITSGYR
ncbi:MAG: NAD+ synthase [Gammaproteobacteria bacterium]|nr:NAD+ synthase [Gammaproteobacteria bacterium]